MTNSIPHKCGGGVCLACRLNSGVDSAARTRGATTARRSLPVRGRCLHVGKRTEFRPGCGGRMCKHVCEAGQPFAVPGGVCQTCQKWEAESDQSATAMAAPPDYFVTPLPPIPGPYSGPTAAATDWRTLIAWNPVPPPDLTPTRSRAVVTIVIGDDAEALHAATGPGQRAYAEKIGAEYVVIRGATQDQRMPCGEKWRLKDYVPLFPGGTVYFDADVWVSPHTPDILAATPDDAVGMVDVAPGSPGLLDWFPPEIERLCKTQGIDVPPLERKYWNSGVWAGRPAQAGYWNPPANPYPVQWCTEEMWCRVQAQLTGLRIHDLDPRFNWTWIEDRTLARVHQRRPWCWHFAGMGNKEAAQLPQWQQKNPDWRLAMLRLLATAAG